jgi:hypothetical protein
MSFTNTIRRNLFETALFRIAPDRVASVRRGDRATRAGVG